MANFKDEILTMTLIINGEKSKQELKELRKEAENVKKKMREVTEQASRDTTQLYKAKEQAVQKLNAAVDNLDKTAAKNTLQNIDFDIKRIESAQHEFINLSAELERLNKEVEDFESSIDITTLSERELREETHRLQMEMSIIKPDSDRYRELSQELDSVRQRTTAVKNGFHLLSEVYDKNNMSVNELNKRMQMLRAELKNLKPEEEADEIERVKKEINELRLASNKLQYNMQDLDKEFDANTASLEELEQRTKSLQNAMKQLKPNDEKLSQYRKELERVNDRHTMVTQGIGRTRLAWDKFAQKANDYQTAWMMIAGAIYSAYSAIANFIKGFSETSDVIGEVMKTTGLTQNAVKELKSEFMDFDTRTANNQLLEYVRVAGKMMENSEKTKENLRDFAKEANIAVVSLGKTLGDNPEDVINTLGKIATVFKLTSEDALGWGGAIRHVGAVINELGKSSAANERPIVEYLARLSAVAPTIKMSFADAAAIGSTLDSLKVNAEMGATAMTKFLFSLGNNATEFAKILGVSIEQYQQMINTDVNDVMIKVLRSAGKNQSGLMSLLSTLDTMDASGVRMQGTIAKLMQNVDELVRQQKISNVEFSKGTSTLNEYNIMNETFAAKMQKANKEINQVIYSLILKLEPTILTIVTSLASFLQWLKNNGTMLLIISKVVAIATTAMLSYKAAIQLATMWTNRKIIAQKLEDVITKAGNIIKGTGIVITNLFAAAQMRLAGNTKGAAQAMAVLNNTIKANPFGLLASAITIAVGAWLAFRDASQESLDIIETTNDLTIQYTEGIIKERSELNNLVGAILNTNEETDLRHKLIKKLQEEYPYFLQNIDAEKLSNERLVEQLQTVNNEYKKKIQLAAIQAKMDATYQRQVQLYVRNLEIESELPELSQRANLGFEQDKKKLEELKLEYQLNLSQAENLQKDLQDLQDKSTKIENELEMSDLDKYLKEFKAVESHLEIIRLRLQHRYQLDIKDQKDDILTKINDENTTLKKQLLYDIEIYDNLIARQEILAEQIDKMQTLTDYSTKPDTDDNLSSADSNKAQQVKKEIDLEALRIEALLKEKAKEIALEKKRHNEKMDEYKDNQKALEYEEIIHKNNLLNINNQYLDKLLKEEEHWKNLSLKNDRDYWELQIEEIKEQLKKGYITQKDANKYIEAVYKDKQEKIAEQEKKIFEFRKQYSLVTTQELLDKELQAVEQTEEFKTLAVEEQEKIRQQIREKYSEKEVEDEEIGDELQRAAKKLVKERDKGVLSQKKFNEDSKSLLENHLKDEIDATHTSINLLGNFTIAVKDANSQYEQALTELNEKYKQSRQELNQQYQTSQIDLNELHQRDQQLRREYLDNLIEIEHSKNATILNAQKTALKELISLLLNALKKRLQIAIAGATIEAIASGGILAPQAIAKIIALEAAFKIAEIGVSQFKQGRYPNQIDVVGKDDMRLYRNTPVLQNAKTGLYKNPMLIAEDGSEIVFAHKDWTNPIVYQNYIKPALQLVKSNQYATGKYPQIEMPAQNCTELQELIKLQKETILKLDKLKDLKAKIYINEFDELYNQFREDRDENVITL